MRETVHLLVDSDFPPLQRGRLETLQVNLGYRCNQTCLHCHVNAGPNRSEVMDADTIELVLDYLRSAAVQRLDLTGGAPEMNPAFRELVRRARAMGVAVMDRCNLTILEEADQQGLAEFLAEHQVEIVASLPCYLEENVDAQRGKGVFSASIRGLQRLNALGYGRDENLPLSLVFNPQGASLPPPQEALEQDYRRYLREQFSVEFTRLLTLANMPIRRFGSTLLSKGHFDEYMSLLRQSFRPENLDGVMCRNLLSVDWRGYVYDCDFNQMLGMDLGGARQPSHLSDLLQQSLEGRDIAVADHCYGCTAGQGSSCGGALSA